MASVNFEKIKAGGKPVSAYIRHDDENERMIHNHANPDIDKRLTHQNKQWAGLSYAETNKKFRDRINFLDCTTNTNKRKDRVECYSLSVPIPDAVKDKEAFFLDLTRMCSDRFGEDNLINSYLHVDEVHDYVDGGVVKTSLEHVHVLVVPELDGKLNGKMFSGKEAMRSFNKEVDEMCREKYHCKFNTGEPARHKTVEELKENSEKELEMLSNLSERTPVTPKKKGLTDVTISKKDYKKLVDKASAYDNISESLQNGISQLEADRMRLQEDYEKAAAYRLNKEKLDKSIEEKQNAESELDEKYEKLIDSVRSATKLKNKTAIELEETQAEYKNYIAKIEDQKKWERDNNSSFDKRIQLEILEAKNERLEKENTLLKNAIKAVAAAVNKIYNYIQKNLDKVPDYIRNGIEKIKEILDNHLEKEHNRDFFER